MFSTRYENFVLFSSNLKLSSANFINLDQSKILSSGNGLIATFQLLSAASSNLGWSQNGALGNGLICIRALFGEVQNIVV